MAALLQLFGWLVAFFILWRLGRRAGRWWVRRRTWRGLAEKPCLVCGEPLGEAALSGAFLKTQHWLPVYGQRFDTTLFPDRTWILTCPHCGEIAAFDEDGHRAILPQNRTEREG